MNSWNIFGVSVKGASHERKSIVCQDACNYIVINPDLAVISIADGLGSVRFPEIGASRATAFSVNYIKEHVEKIPLNENDNNKAISLFFHELIEKTRDHLKEAATEIDGNFDDMASTLIVIVLNGSTALVAHIGDGAAIVKTGDQFEFLSEPEPSEYSNEVYPLTSKDWENHLWVNHVDNVEAIAVFTDGCQRALLTKKDGIWKPYNDAFAYLFTWAQEQTDENQANEDIEKFLSNIMSTKSDDDKTLVLAVKHQ